jgi:hypothetical protein
MISIEGTWRVTSRTVQSFLTWNWTRQLLHWLIMSAGTVSELAFLLASIWVSLNASVHRLILTVMNEQTSRFLTELAAAAYIVLPELIIGLAIVTTLNHFRVWFYDRKQITSLVWSVLFGIPTCIFLLLSIVTLGNAVANAAFQLPEPLVILRAIAGFWYAFISLLFTQIGRPSEVNRLQQKDQTIAQLQKQNRTLEDRLREQTAENEQAKRQIDDLKMTLSRVEKTMNKSADATLHAYSAECQAWLKSGIKTASIEEITRYTGHSKRKIQNAIAGGHLFPSTRNKELILVSSLILWLKENPPASLPKSGGDEQERDRQTGPMLHVL